MAGPARLGIVGGLGALGAADVLHKLVETMSAGQRDDPPELIFEQRRFREGANPGDAAASQHGRKLYVYDLLRSFERRGVEAVLLPCFLSHTFVDELSGEVQVPIVNLMEALHLDLVQHHPGVRRLGILTSDYVRANGLFERHFPSAAWSLLYPDEPLQRDDVMAALYGPHGLKRGSVDGPAVDRLARAGRHLLERGAELIVPGFTEIPLVLNALRSRGLPVLDVNRCYARHALSVTRLAPPRTFKVGVVGGVGPAATVDFLAKIVRHTPAGCDQDHIKVVVEQNPQIPDRTRHLLGEGPDPTVSLYATCKRLEAAGADVIAIPCNTAHAYVSSLLPSLAVPIVDMLATTVAHLHEQPAAGPVGLLATTGTVRSGLYQAAMAGRGLELLVPDEDHQARVMEAIYGPHGIKAGCTEGACRTDLQAALAHLVGRGARHVILGCTELPLVLPSTPALWVGGAWVTVVDPTELLARRCIELALSERRSAT